MESLSNSETPSRKEVWRLFDRIAHRYDLLNRMLSFGQDVVWRNRMAKRLKGRQDLEILDLATGTADQLLSMVKRAGSIQKAIGIDMSEKMLEHGLEKVKAKGLEDKIHLEIGDATELQFEDNRFDVVSISFGIRNVIDVEKSLKGIYRVLKPGGIALILEFSLPRNRLFRGLYLFYFRHILPRIGGLISGDHYAYNYLNKTVETFPYGQAFCDLMTSAGLIHNSAKPMTFGIASIYQGVKPEND